MSRESVSGNAERPPVGVIGVGWVGLVTAACFAELGHEVWCRDIDASKVESLRAGDVPIYEPGLAELVAKNRERLHFEFDLAPVLEHARLLFTCVDTPPTYSGDADLSRVWSVVSELPASSEHALVMKSTVPVGTGASIRRRLAEIEKSSLAYISNPEFLKEGSAVDDFMRPDRVVVGGGDDSLWAADAVAELYAPLDCPIVRTDVESAEMTKLASNAFLATKISFINEIANVCEEVGADVAEVATGMGLDPRIGDRFLNAGIGYGGSCLAGYESVLVRRGAKTTLMALEGLFATECPTGVFDAQGVDVLRPEGLEVLSWRDGHHAPEFRPVSAVTRRAFKGEILEVKTKMGRRLRCTPDHPFVVTDADHATSRIKRAGELTEEDWLPVAQGGALDYPETSEALDTLAAVPAGGLNEGDVIVRPLAPTGYRRHSENTAWVRVTDIEKLPFDDYVYSVEVPGTETFVTTGGLVVHNCFPKDVSALKQLAGNSGYHFQLLNAVIEVNELQKRRVVNKLKKHLGSLVGKQIGLLGLAFKPHTDDMREASSVVLAARLQGEGARVKAFDPVAEDRAHELITGVEMCDSALDVLNGADAAVVVTEWPEFAELDLEEARMRMNNPLMVDGRNLFSPEKVRAAGFLYEGIGRS